MIARVSYRSSTLKYATPYTFKGAVPKSELTGPVYQNTFTYHSAQLPIPSLTPDLKQRLVASIQASHQIETGAPPAADSDDGTYGNAISVAKVHSEKIRKLSEQARAAKAVNSKKKTA